MITETETTTSALPKHIPFGARLQTAREALGLESKDAAAQLRLNERVILMMETDCYSSDIPPTFMRGYIRAYGKLLQIPDHEIKLAIEPIKPPTEPVPAPSLQTTPPVTSGNYFMQIFTYLIIFTLVGLVGTWWYTHSKSPAFATSTSENQVALPMETIDPTATPPAAVAPTINEPVQTLGMTTANNTAMTTSTTMTTTMSAQPAAPKATTPPSKTTTHHSAKSQRDDSDDEEDEEDTQTNSYHAAYRR